MSQNVIESSASTRELHAIVSALQVDRSAQANRDERIERELTEMRKSAAKTESNIAKLTNVLTKFMSESGHMKAELVRFETTQNKHSDMITVLQIHGKERETKIKILMFFGGAISTALLTWLITSIKG